MITRKSKVRPEEEPAAAEPENVRPTLRSVAPRWAALSDKWAEFARREEEIYAELKPLNEQVSKLGGYSSFETIVHPPRPPEPKEHRSAIVQLLGPLTPKIEKRAEDPPKAFATQAAQAKALSAELDAIREARGLIAEEIRRLNFEGSRELCLQLLPEYRPIAKRLCSALIELGEAWCQHEAWMTDLKRQGTRVATLRPMLISSPDDLGDPIERLRRLLIWAAEGGHFDPADIPASWSKHQ